jgi:carboxymethylenebutenolidase
MTSRVLLKKDKVMKELNPDQKYFIEEFYEDFREGLMTRREFIKRVAYITGSMAATAATMGLIGCSPEEIPDPTEPMPTPEPPMAESDTAVEEAPAVEEPVLVPVPGAQSPFSVPEGDPAVLAETVTFASQGDDINGYLAQPVEAGSYPAVLVCHENRGLNDHIRFLSWVVVVASGYYHRGHVHNRVCPDITPNECHIMLARPLWYDS